MTHNIPDGKDKPIYRIRICYFCDRPIGIHDKYVHMIGIPGGPLDGKLRHRDCKHPTEYPKGTKIT